MMAAVVNILAEAEEKNEIGGLTVVDIYARLQVPSWRRWWHLGTLYHALIKLEGDKVVASHWVPGAYPRKRVYSLMKEPGSRSESQG